MTSTLEQSIDRLCATADGLKRQRDAALAALLHCQAALTDPDRIDAQDAIDHAERVLSAKGGE